MKLDKVWHLANKMPKNPLWMPESIGPLNTLRTAPADPWVEKYWKKYKKEELRFSFNKF